MKNYVLIAGFILLGSIHGFSQMVAPNWTLNDCSSNSHTLHNYLDSQEVVVMEFVMGCATCTNAGTYLMNLKNQYDVSHPGKVNFFLMDYYPSNNCGDVTSTWGSYNFHAYFSGCWAEKEVYYPTLYPMPAVVIAAGNYHTVIYDDLSWQTSDTTLIKQAIDQFFVTVGVENENKNEQVTIYPNPANEVLYTDLSGFHGEDFTVQVYNMLGEKVKAVQYRIDKNLLVLYTYYYTPGNYILELTTPSTVVRKMFVKS